MVIGIHVNMLFVPNPVQLRKLAILVCDLFVGQFQVISVLYDSSKFDHRLIQEINFHCSNQITWSLTDCLIHSLQFLRINFRFLHFSKLQPTNVLFMESSEDDLYQQTGIPLYQTAHIEILSLQFLHRNVFFSSYFWKSRVSIKV